MMKVILKKLSLKKNPQSLTLNATAKVNSTSIAGIGGAITAAITIIQNVTNSNGGHASASGFTITLRDGQFLATFAGSGQGTHFQPNQGMYQITDIAPAGYLFKSITGDPNCPQNLGQQFSLDKGQSITCTITYNDSGIADCSPTSGNWNVTSSCTITGNPTTITGDVTVNSGVVITIPAGKSLDINFGLRHLLVKSGGAILIKAGGKIS